MLGLKIIYLQMYWRHNGNELS